MGGRVRRSSDGSASVVSSTLAGALLVMTVGDCARSPRESEERV